MGLIIAHLQTDAAGNSVGMNVSTTVVIARKEFLGNYAPTIAATNLSFIASCDSINLNFNRGNGNGHLIIAREAMPVSVSPSDGITYSANNTFGNGDDLGMGSFAVYDGLDSSITIKGLTHNTTYHLSIFEYSTMPNRFYKHDIPTKDSIRTTTVATSSIMGIFKVKVSSTQQYQVSNTNGSTYTWATTEGTITAGQGTNQISLLIPAFSGSLDLKVIETNINGCQGDTITQVIQHGPVGVESYHLENSICIIPNPSDGKALLKIEGNNNPLLLVIYDMVGKEVLRANQVLSNYEIDLSKQKKGTYFLQLSSGRKVATKRLVIH